MSKCKRKATVKAVGMLKVTVGLEEVFVFDSNIRVRVEIGGGVQNMAVTGNYNDWEMVQVQVQVIGNSSMWLTIPRQGMCQGWD